MKLKKILREQEKEGWGDIEVAMPEMDKRLTGITELEYDPDDFYSHQIKQKEVSGLRNTFNKFICGNCHNDTFKVADIDDHHTAARCEKCGAWYSVHSG